MSQDSIVVKVTFEDTDCTGRIYFARYVKWLDDAISNYLSNRGFEYDDKGFLVSREGSTRLAFVVGEYYARIEKPSKLGDRLRVEVKPAEIRRRVVVFEGTIVDTATNIEVARGRIALVHVDPSTGKSKDMPDWLVKMIGAKVDEATIK